MNRKYVDIGGGDECDGEAQENEEQDRMQDVQAETPQMRRVEACVQSVRPQRPLVPGVPTRN